MLNQHFFKSSINIFGEKMLDSTFFQNVSSTFCNIFYENVTIFGKNQHFVFPFFHLGATVCAGSTTVGGGGGAAVQPTAAVRRARTGASRSGGGLGTGGKPRDVRLGFICG
jgi:hypothetical protein